MAFFVRDKQYNLTVLCHHHSIQSHVYRKSSAYLAKLSHFGRTIYAEISTNSKFHSQIFNLKNNARTIHKLLNDSYFIEMSIAHFVNCIYFCVVPHLLLSLWKQLPVNIDKELKCLWKVDLVALSTELRNNTFDRVCSYALSILQLRTTKGD